MNHRERLFGTHPPGRGRWFPGLATGLTVLVFGAALFLVSQHLRGQIRDQITGRDGEALHAVALMHQYEEGPELDLFGTIEEPHRQLDVLLKTSRLKGVIAARLFDPQGTLLDAVPLTVKEAELPESVLPVLAQLKPASRFHPEARLEEIFFPGTIPDEQATVPLLEVNIPLHVKGGENLAGVAQFLIDGESMAQEFAALDRHLFRQAGWTFLAGGLLISIGLGWAFGRLQRTNRLLGKRTEELVRANRELVLASKTSAVGAVAAHLIHGLRNPLFGLKNLADQGTREGRFVDTRWETAAAATDQMQVLVNEVVRLLRDEQDLVECEVAFADLVETIETKFNSKARAGGVGFRAFSSVHESLPHREASLLLLILHNLIQNALEATPPGKRTRLMCVRDGAEIVCEVQDEGGGISLEARETLFQPGRSSKPGNSGIGLAISKQLANHLGARLELKESGPSGTVFCLRLGASAFQETRADSANMARRVAMRLS